MTDWTPQLFTPYPDHPDVVMARIAARSAAFGATSAAGGAPVLVGSATGHRRERVAAGARGELLERLGNVMAGREAEAAAETVGTLAELREAGHPVLEPKVRPDARRLWVRGRTVRGADVLVAASSVFLQHRPPPRCEGVPAVGSTGVAAHPDPTAAIRHAAWEVLERDLVRRSWYGLDPQPPVRLTTRVPSPLAELILAQQLVATAFRVPAPTGAVCAVVCLHRPDGSGQTFGARCGPATAVPALVETAAYEALMVRWSMDTPVARRTWDQWHGSSPPTTAVQHALWAYHRQDSLRLWGVRTHERPRDRDTPYRPRRFTSALPDGPTDRRAAAPGETDAFTDPAGTGPDPLALLARHTGREVITVETTAKPARDAGVRVVRVLAPGAGPLPSRTDSGPPHPFG